MNLHAFAIPTYVQMLRSLSANLDKGLAFAEAKGVEHKVLLTARLAPDMFPLGGQVKIACALTRDAVARLGGVEAPKADFGPASFAELKALIDETIVALEATPQAAFNATADRMLAVEPTPGLVFDMTGLQFIRDWSLPNFYFHVSTAYDILRHNGVRLGKADFISHVGAYMRPGSVVPKA